ncbi:MAG: selenocysteine-specific translation elongation factor [Actinomycetota bacterium]
MHVIGTAGHVDHGKSALVQRLTGIDPDRFEEEKRRGLTIDLGFAWLPLPSGNEIGVIDVPGHERFIKNMLAGAGGISVCLFVVAANEGWMPQSTEHLAILDVLGIGSGVVALTKSDTVDAATLEIARQETEEHLGRTQLAGSPVVAVSAVTGEGLEDLVARLDEAVTAAPVPEDRGRPRLWIDRVFSISGAGTVVTGTLSGGALQTDQEIEISPEGRRARIRSIQSHKKQLGSVGPANRVALNLVGLDRGSAKRGDAIVVPSTWRPTRTIDAEVHVLPEWAVGPDHVLTEKGSHLLYVGSVETPVRIKLFEASSLRAGGSGFAQLYLRDALPLARGDRFVLRDAGRMLSFGGGIVLDPLAARTQRGDEKRLALLRRLSGAPETEALAALVEAEGRLSSQEALLRAGLSSVPAGVAALDDLLVSDERLERLQSRVRATLAEHHAAKPLESGMQRAAVRTAAELEPGAFDALVETLDDVESDGALLHLKSHAVSMSPEQQQARDEVLSMLEAGVFTPPLGKDLEADPALLRALVDSGELVRIGDFYLTAARAQEARQRVRTAIESGGPMTVAQIRDLLGTSRKYAVPLCEWLDQTGATLRRGDTRILGPHP